MSKSKNFKGELPLILCGLTPEGQEVFAEYCQSMSRILALPASRNACAATIPEPGGLQTETR
jgi:hypothetical protein